MIIPKNSKEIFEKQKYVLVKDFLPLDMRNLAYRYGSMKSDTKHNDGVWNDAQTPGSYSSYGDTLMECILEMSWPYVEKITGIKLWPTYSYFRTYKNGDVLANHKDRPSCEISYTLNLGQEDSTPWPIYMEDKRCDLNPGDLVIYRGTELYHRREANPGGRCVQLFCHYIDKAGPFGNICKYDGRPMLGMPHTSKDPQKLRDMKEAEQLVINAKHNNKKT